IVKDIYPGPGSSNPFELIVIDGTLYFSAADAASGLELWRSDGTMNGTVLVQDIAPGGDSSRTATVGATVRRIVDAGKSVLFTAHDGVSGVELWMLDKKGVAFMVQDIAPGAASSSPEALTVTKSLIFFTAEDTFTGRELWVMPGFVANL